jgi:hypothetical protein
MKRAMLTLIGLVVAAGVVAADATPNLDQGTKELRLSGRWDSETPLGDQVNLAAGLGYFVVDNLEIGVAAGGDWNDARTLFEVGGFVEYHLNMGSPVVPYIGLGGFFVGAEVDDDIYEAPDEDDLDADTSVGRGFAGIKWFIDDNVAITLRGTYSFSADDLWADEDGEMQDNNATVDIGIRFYWD